MTITYTDTDGIEFEFNAELREDKYNDLYTVIISIPKEYTNMMRKCIEYANKYHFDDMERELADDRHWTRQGMDYFEHN